MSGDFPASTAPRDRELSLRNRPPDDANRHREACVGNIRTRRANRSVYDRDMSQIIKTVRLGGSSPDSIEDAVRTVLARAAITIDEITGFTLKEVTGTVDEAGVPTSFDVSVDITFVVKESVHG